jgi:hypothetical protein
MEKIISLKKAATLLGFSSVAKVLELIRKGNLNGKIENKRYVVIVDEKLKALSSPAKHKNILKSHRLFQEPHYRKRWPRLLNQISR